MGQTDFPGLPLSVIQALIALDGARITSGTVAADRLGVFTADAGAGGAKGAVPAPGAGSAALGMVLTAAGWNYPSLLMVGRLQAGVGGAATFEWTNLPQYGGDLIVVWGGRTLHTSDASVSLRFNDDAGAHYVNQFVTGVGTTLSTSTTSAGTSCDIGACKSDTDTAGKMGGGTAEVINYASTSPKLFKHFSARCGYGDGPVLLLREGNWKQTAGTPITKVSCFTSVGWAEGSFATLFIRK